MLGLLAFASLTVREHAPRRSTSFFLPEAFKNPPYVLVSVGFFASLFGFWTPIFFSSSLAISHGLSPSTALAQLAVLNAGSFFGRTLPNYLAVKTGAFNMYMLMCACTSIMLFCWTAATSSAGIYAYNAFYGLFCGALVSLASPCLAQVCPRPSEIGTYIGMGLAFCSLGGLAGTPVNGALIARHGFLSASMFSAVMVLIGTGCVLAARLHLERSIFVKI